MIGRSSLTIRKASRLLEKQLITCEELVSYCNHLAVAGEEIWGLAAYSHIVSRANLLDLAQESDGRRKHGETLSILDGIPVSIKENIAVRDVSLTAGSRILGRGMKDHPPCGYDADVVRKLLRESGAIMMGTTTMDEFGMGSLGMNMPTTPAKNPLPYMRNLTPNDLTSLSDDEVDLFFAKLIKSSQDEILEIHSKAFDESLPVHSTGGSSSGSAVSVTHGSALLSLGTDTGGSVRLPAAWCGIVGLKPSYGVLSRHGIVSYASSFDTVGVLAPSVECASIALDILGERDEAGSRDSTASQLQFQLKDFDEKQAAASERPLEGVKVGIPASLSIEECPDEIREAWMKAANFLSQRGATVMELSTDELSVDLVQLSLATYYILVSAEASSNLSRYDGFRYGVAATRDDASSESFHLDATDLERQYAATRTEGFGIEVSRRVLCGASVLSSDRFHSHYEAAAKLRAALASQMHSSLKEKVDVLLYPTALSAPPRIDQGEIDSTETFANDVMTVPASLAGLPAISIPVAPKDDGRFPLALQLVGYRHGEATILNAARVLQDMSP
ncbi:unnamed protein product [Cylindrotheca closterium]|uniref:Amidase domain-containing protein n=1 Tax=Cylindrotheca closterium TaxID=2856 RepID=A0AAD2PY10_9STRA|nr:unnamed protein product [Cylindrotheca closterium]